MEAKNKELETVRADAAKAVDEAQEKAKKQIEKKHDDTDRKIESAEKKADGVAKEAKPAAAEGSGSTQLDTLRNDVKALND